MKVGDKVKIVAGADVEHAIGDTGVIIEDDFGTALPYMVAVADKGTCWYQASELQLIEEKSMNPYKKGQVLVNKVTETRKQTVMETLGDLVFVSKNTYPEEYWGTLHYKQVEGAYTVEIPPTDIKEVTLDEIAKQFNVPVDKIRVKD